MKLLFFILFSVTVSIYSQEFTICKSDSDSLWYDIDNINNIYADKFDSILMAGDKLILFVPGKDAWCLMWADIPEKTRKKLIKRNLFKS